MAAPEYVPDTPELPGDSFPAPPDSGACPDGMEWGQVSGGGEGCVRTAPCPDGQTWNNPSQSCQPTPVYPQPTGGNGGNNSPAPSGPRPPYAPSYNIPGAPMFAGLADFQAPSFEEAMNDPGYRFAVDEGRRAREASAASRGDLRTGGTLRSLDRYGQNMGAQQYSNVYGRRFGEYGQRYRQALDQYSPRLAEWTLRSNAEIGRQNIGNQNQWGEYWGNNLTAAQLMALLQGI